VKFASGLLLGSALLVGGFLAACGSGSNSPVSGTLPSSGTTQPVAGPSSPPVAVAGSTQPTTTTLPAFNGITSALSVGGASTANAAVTISTSASPPPGIPTVSGNGVRTVLAYANATTTNTVTYPTGTQMAISVPPSQISTGAASYLAVNTGSAWYYQSVVGVPSNGGTTLTFTVNNGLTLNPGTPYTVAFYQ
jgi:hypothetical protein